MVCWQRANARKLVQGAAISLIQQLTFLPHLRESAERLRIFYGTFDSYMGCNRFFIVKDSSENIIGTAGCNHLVDSGVLHLQHQSALGSDHWMDVSPMTLDDIELWLLQLAIKYVEPYASSALVSGATRTNVQKYAQKTVLQQSDKVEMLMVLQDTWPLFYDSQDRSLVRAVQTIKRLVLTR